VRVKPVFTYIDIIALTFNVDADDVVSILKAKLQNRLGIPTDQQVLYHAGRQLQNGRFPSNLADIQTTFLKQMELWMIQSLIS
jgi:hypothetical protein